jgi:hypothetical protein
MSTRAQKCGKLRRHRELQGGSIMKVPEGDLVGISREELVRALQESVGLQSHYAQLLNQHDDGGRIGFGTVSAWIHRLREIAPPAR